MASLKNILRVENKSCRESQGVRRKKNYFVPTSCSKTNMADLRLPDRLGSKVEAARVIILTRDNLRVDLKILTNCCNESYRLFHFNTTCLINVSDILIHFLTLSIYFHVHIYNKRWTENQINVTIADSKTTFNKAQD